MKQKIFLFITITLFSNHLFGLPFSPATRRLIEQTKPGLSKAKVSDIEALKRQFSLQTSDEGLTVSALIKVNEAFNSQDLHALNVEVRVQNEDLISINCLTSSLEALGNITGILSIEVDTPVFYKMDEARSDINAVEVHAGTNLNKSYTGQNVLIGIIDSGFDYTHPAFENASGQSRIYKVWDQRDFSGTPPVIGNQVSIGSEYTGQAIINKMHDNDFDGVIKTHGTQVAGPAVGIGADPGGLFGGIAPDANIILITNSGGAASVFDALDYIFENAQSLNMPAVANISFGNHQGAHDGTSTIDQYIDRVSGPGKIVVGSVGNEGDKDLHVSHTFSGETIRVSPVTTDGETVVDIWGAPSGAFEVSVGVVNAGTHQIVAQTTFFETNNSAYQEGVVQGTTKYVVSAVQQNLNNQKPNMQVWISNVGAYPPVLLIKANSGTVHMWNLYDNEGFTDFGRSDLYVPGDNVSTVDEICATSKSIIAVGSYLTKKTYRDMNNSLWQISTSSELYDIAAFSSRGPTIDGRIKPDISAPGEVLVIPYSSYTTETIPDNVKVAKVGGFWPYGAFSGTSFSAPIVAGVVGLMLEANPNLDPDDIKDIFSHSTKKDNFTQSTPNNTWGYGKVNAYNAVSRAINYTSVSENHQPYLFELYQNYPNPFNPETSIQYTLGQTVRVSLSIYNQNGQLVQTLVEGQQAAGVHHITWHASAMPSGLYFCKLQTAHQTAVQKMMLIR